MFDNGVINGTSIFFLTQQAALPSRKVLRKVIQFSTALAQPIVVLVEDHRRSEDHAFAHFLSFNSDHIEKKDKLSLKLGP